MKPLVGKRLMGPPESEMMCRDVAESQANLEEPAPWRPFVRAYVCVVSLGVAENCDTLKVESGPASLECVTR